MSSTSGKSLRDDQNDRVREIVRELVAKEFAGNATAAARAFGVRQSLVSEFLSGARGAGPKLINGIAEHTGRSIDDLYGRRVVRVGEGHRAMQRLGDRPDFQPALEEAVERSRTADRAQLEGTAEVAFTFPPETLTADYLIRLAETMASAKPYKRG